MQYGLLLKSGILIDPAQGIHAVKDIGFVNGNVAAIEDSLSPSDAVEVVDCSGLIVAPGMIDLHVHVFWGVGHYGIEPDPICIARGITTAVDAGSAGADTFLGFRKYVTESSATRIFAQLNISSQGLLSDEIGELDDIRYANVAKAVAMIEHNRDVILGVKVRLDRNLSVSKASGIRPLYLALEAAKEVDLPIMVHPQAAYCDSIDDILLFMREGDILTHCFHGKKCGILDDNGQIRKSVREARERGVIFDLGHGRSSHKWEISERALEQGFLPDTISSDLHAYNVNGPVYDLATTVSKFLYLGLSLDDALGKVTAKPAEILGMSNKIGTLKPGAWGDAVVFEVQEGSFEFRDSHGQVRIGKQRIVPTIVVKAGNLYRRATGSCDG